MAWQVTNIFLSEAPAFWLHGSGLISQAFLEDS